MASESYRQCVESYARDFIKTARTIASHEEISMEAAALAIVAAALLQLDKSVNDLRRAAKH